ncbi:MAG: insulinase family protein [Patescibacteria group bacterium]|nr:insulinase family protein [Patescibacteria group bacterium]
MKINETIRRDGLRIISCYIPYKRTIELELVSRAGFAYDPEDKKGLFHSFEHMAFKGTKNRSIKELQSFARKNLIDFSASTGALSTTYNVTIIDRKLPQACDYLMDIYLNSVFPEKELEKEKKTILLEIARRKDSDIQFAFDNLNKHLYKENPMRAEGGGTPEGLGRITRDDLIEANAKWHVPAATVVVAIGNVKHKEFVGQISKHFPANGRKISLDTWSDEHTELPQEKEVVITKPDRQKETVVVGCKLPEKLTDKEEESMLILSKLMAGGASSILWDNLREKRGLVYVVGGGCQKIDGLANLFMVYLETNFKDREKAKKILWESLLRPLSQKREFEELKEKIFDAFEISAAEHARDYESLIWQKIARGQEVKQVEKDDAKRLNIISSLTLKDLERVKKKFIKPERFVTVIITPGGSDKK